MTVLERWTLIPVIALLSLISATATAQPVTVTLVLISGERHTGENLQHRGDNRGGGEVSLRKSLHDQLRIGAEQVAYVDFGGTADAAVTLGGSQRAVVLRSGAIIRGQLIQMGHSSFEDPDTPYLVIIRDEQGRERRLSASAVARVYFRASSTPAASPSPTEPPTGGGVVVPARQRWTSTGIVVQRGEVITLIATGEIRLSADADDTAGTAGARSLRISEGGPIPGALEGALIGRIGTRGLPFGIGDQTSVRMPEAGELFLGINDDSPADNRGEFRVEIRRASSSRRR